jgi:hypothetical protein
MAIPSPSNVAPWYLRDMCQALELDPVSGNVFIRTGLSNSIVNITGPVSIPGLVTITGNANITSMPPITGNVNANITGGNSNVTILGNVPVTQASSPWVVSGNVNANITGGNSNVAVTGNIAGITSLPPITQGTSPWIVSGTLTPPSVSNVVITGTNIDAFGRLRVSEPYTLFNSALSGERRYDFSSQTAGGGAVNFDFNANVRQLQVNSVNAASQVIRESMLTFPYQPGKSLLIMHSVCFADWTYNTIQKAGLFSASNGVYFQQVGKIVSFVIRSSSSGVLSEEVIPQSSWNGDKLNGTGPSGITLNPSATQLLWHDVEWLGVGSIRCGFVINGQFILCHTFNHANNPAYPTTYMGTATLPMRYELTSTGGGIGTATMQQICCTVMSEGGYNESTFTYSAGTGISSTRLVNSGTYYPIVSIRLNSGFLDSIVKLAQVDILSPSVNYYRWVVLKNATLTGATWAYPAASNKVDVDTAATAISGGIEIQSGFAASRETMTLGELGFYARLGRTVGGVSDVFTLALAAENNNADVCAQMGWEEIL